MPTINQPLPGFEHINRYWDPHQQRMSAKILPGEFYVTTHDENILTTLGSCVSACIWDPDGKIGGMNHIMLPGGNESSAIDFSNPTEATRYGSFAMEHMINAILKHGGRRPRLLAKVVGGGKVLRHVSNVGERNIAFVREFLATEGLHVLGEHVGGNYPRKVCFRPQTGHALVKELRSTSNDTIADREQRYAARLRSETLAQVQAVELF